METPRGTRLRTFLLSVLAVEAWVVASSAQWSWALAARGWLPPALGPATPIRGSGTAVRGVVALVSVLLTVWCASRLTSGLGATLTGVAAVVLALLVVGPPPYYGARTTFDVVRPQLERAAALRNGYWDADLYGGDPLPRELVDLTATGTTLSSPGMVFFPQWLGIPDDAGGFFFVEHGSPAGYDMYGMECTDPIRLDEHWWACGMSPDPGGRW
jgi:hypothetical protein